MPWKETCTVSERHHLISLVVREGLPVSEACRSLGISRKTAYEWIARHSADGAVGLEDRSRARLTQPHRVASWIAEELLALRRRTGEGPGKLLARLGRAHPGEPLPSASTAARSFAVRDWSRREAAGVGIRIFAARRARIGPANARTISGRWTSRVSSVSATDRCAIR